MPPLRFDESSDSLLRICALLAAIAAAMLVISMQQDVPDTMANAVINAVRFVLGVGVAIGGVIVMVERRVAGAERGAEAVTPERADSRDDDLVLDLGDLDLRDRPTTPAAAFSASAPNR
jgi:hypothetical protein